MPGAQETAFFRITVLGKEKCGKTALINAWVNHFAPGVHTPTDYPSLYYKTVVLKEGEEEEDFPVLVEVEDTYASNRGDGFIYDQAGKHEPRNVSMFLDMGRRDTKSEAAKKAANEGTLKSTAPLAVYDAPKVNRYKPLTKCRMGFMFVFDAHDSNSYKEALQLHLALQEDLEKKKVRLSPVQFLVATKGDQDPTNADYLQIMQAAAVYSEEKMIKLMEVSAVDFGFKNGVENLFMSMIRTIKQNQILWMLDDGPGSSGDGGTADAAQKCSVQ